MPPRGYPDKQRKKAKLGFSRITYLWERSFGEDYQQAGLQQDTVNNVENA